MANEYEVDQGAQAFGWADWLWQNKQPLLWFYYAAVAGGVILLLSLPPTFQSTAIVSIQPTDRPGVPPLSVEQAARSQIALLQSEDVIRRAIDKVGVAELKPAAVEAATNRSTKVGTFFRGMLKRVRGESEGLSPADAVFVAVGDAIDARVGANTNLIHLAFKHRDAAVAKRFTQAWVESFVDRYYELYSNGNAVSFFQNQQLRSAASFKDASARLSEFSAKNNVFEVGEQRRLLLQERNALATGLTTTQGAIQQVAKQIETIPVQLDRMKHFGALPQVKSLAPARVKSNVDAGDEALTTRLASDPPLLLVRVYQDTIASLIKLTTDVAGLRALAESQTDNLRRIDQQLSGLSGKEAEYQSLILDVNQARTSAELYSKRAVEEQLSHDLDANMLSSVRVVQSATVPIFPSWPNKKIIISLALILGFLPLFVAAGRYLLYQTDRSNPFSKLWSRDLRFGS